MNLAELVYLGNFEEASKITLKISPQQIYESLREKAHEEIDIVFYGFFVHLLLHRPKKDLAELHHNVSLLLFLDLRSINGAYDLAEYHIKEAIKYDPEDEDYHRYLEHLKSIPR
ncbi:hypothetical protein WAF17_11085 [Bernardetia sp. ABR2-2B]|uniref:hypothetical protein n=1 Tax=Bernardetia sp. ABR2-2B TaxID=3127472 RepID=UPI0030D31392